MGRDTLQEVRDGSGHPTGGPVRVGTPSGRFGIGRDTLWEVWDILREVQYGSGHPPGGEGRVRTPSGRSGTVQDTLREVLGR